MSNGNDSNDPWTERINAIGNILVKVATVLGPLLTALVLYYQSLAKQSADVAAEHAKEAKVEATALKQEATAQFREIDKKQDANLKQWKAYNSKDPDDMEQAQRAIRHVEASEQKADPKKSS